MASDIFLEKLDTFLIISFLFLRFSSIILIIALPITIPSTFFFNSNTCFGVEMPKPTQIGLLVCFFNLFINGTKFESSEVLVPVTPVTYNM